MGAAGIKFFMILVISMAKVSGSAITSIHMLHSCSINWWFTKVFSARINIEIDRRIWDFKFRGLFSQIFTRTLPNVRQWLNEHLENSRASLGVPPREHVNFLGAHTSHCLTYTKYLLGAKPCHSYLWVRALYFNNLQPLRWYYCILWLLSFEKTHPSLGWTSQEHTLWWKSVYATYCICHIYNTAVQTAMIIDCI